MRTLLRERYLPMFMLLAGCAIGPIALLHFFGSQPVQFGAEVHFLPIAISAGLAAGAAVALTVAAPAAATGARCWWAPPSRRWPRCSPCTG